MNAPLYRTDANGKYILTDLGDGTVGSDGNKFVIGTRGRRYKIGDASEGTLLAATKAWPALQAFRRYGVRPLAHSGPLLRGTSIR